ncbi:hypothetical protein PHYBOEH_008447 [Phytophthora boehmeriae]|uniref:M96 mating-specific protein family n=1 Tax=Phytophthora boehmeriae TaxID=109152 RepID=A0A8T1W0P2_9STRA|nr:hypothetical protein PHYBOEH_008447 [Phytophthora boehmeriae]
MDDDLMEALGCMLPNSHDFTGSTRLSSCQFDVDAVVPVHPKESVSMGEDVQLSLEIQELFPFNEADKVAPKCQQTIDSDHDATSSDRSPEEPAQPMKVTDRRLRPFSTSKRRNRRRPKHELDYLRAKVVELKEELAALGKQEGGSPVKMTGTLMASGGMFENLRVPTTVLVAKDTKMECSSWKEAAELQKTEVDNSIAENRRLRDRLLGQLQVARVLEAAIEQHQKDPTQTLPWKTIVGDMQATNQGEGVPRPRVGSPDDLVFAELNRRVATQYGDVDAVLTTRGLSNILHDLKGGLQFKREASGVSFRHEEARLLPFTMQSMHHTLWNFLRGKSHSSHVNALTNDHLNLIFHETVALSKSRHVQVTKRAAFRRYFEQDRVVFVWNSYVEIDGSVFVRLREKGWSTNSTFEFHHGVTAGANTSSDYVQGCIARMAVQLTPEVSEFRSEREARQHVGEVTNLIVGTYQHSFGLIHEVVEKLLLKGDGKVERSGYGSNLITSQ